MGILGYSAKNKAATNAPPRCAFDAILLHEERGTERSRGFRSLFRPLWPPCGRVMFFTGRKFVILGDVGTERALTPLVADVNMQIS